MVFEMFIYIYLLAFKKSS